MRRELLHTPEGVRDIYNGECDKKQRIEQELHQTFLSFGYHTIQTPTFEFFDVFNREIGTIPSKDLYKFFDREGNTLVLRPDMTPSIARAAAMYFGEETMPIRLCYAGNIFINNNSYQGRLKESTQLGAELIGDDSIEADAEILAMAVECLKKAGLEKFQISIGHAGFLKGLMEEAGLNEEQEEELRELISNKNFFGVEEFIGTLEIAEDLKELFSKGYILEDSENMTENQIVTRMTENQFAMIYAGPWLFTKIIDAYPMSTESDKTPLGEEIPENQDPVTYRLGWFFLGNDNGHLTALTRNNAYWALSETCTEDTRKKEAAQRFLKFFYTKENYRSMIQGMYGLPVTKEAIIYPAPSAQQKLLKDYRYADKNTVYLGMQGTASSFLTDVNKILKELYTGEYTVEKTAEEIDQAWDREAQEE